jgi:hypothetical protein
MGSSESSKAPIITLNVISLWECPLSIMRPAIIPVIAEAIRANVNPIDNSAIPQSNQTFHFNSNTGKT